MNVDCLGAYVECIVTTFLYALPRKVKSFLCLFSRHYCGSSKFGCGSDSRKNLVDPVAVFGDLPLMTLLTSPTCDLGLTVGGKVNYAAISALLSYLYFIIQHFLLLIKS
jgi:hypothetical protein